MKEEDMRPSGPYVINNIIQLILAAGEGGDSQQWSVSAAYYLKASPRLVTAGQN
jgi:hypothetical protein